jgi:hypothetical protein
MRLSVFFAAVISTTMASVGFASENASFSVATQVLKFGYSKLKSTPADGASTSSSQVYSNFLGLGAESEAPAYVELGFKNGDYVAYLYPMGSASDRSVWLGKALSENLEVGVVFGGHSKSFTSGEKQNDGTTLKSIDASQFGVFAIQSLELFGQDFELTLTPSISMASGKYEESYANTEELGYGAAAELIYQQEVAKNLTFGTGLSLDWSTNKLKKAGKETATVTESDVGFHLGRIRWSL